MPFRTEANTYYCWMNCFSSKKLKTDTYNFVQKVFWPATFVSIILWVINILVENKVLLAGCRFYPFNVFEVLTV